MELEAAGFVQAFFFQCGDCYALVLADGWTALECHGPLPGVEVRGVEEHVRHDGCEHDG